MRAKAEMNRVDTLEREKSLMMKTKSVTLVTAWSAFAGSLLALGGCSSGEPRSAAVNPEATTAASQALDREGEGEDDAARLLVRAFGADLAHLAAFAVTTEGAASIEDESFHAGQPAVPASDFQRTTTVDLVGDRFRFDVTRTLEFQLLKGTPSAFRLVIDGEHGETTNTSSVAGVTGESAVGFPPGPLASQRIGAQKRETQLLFPHILVRQVLRGERRARVDGRQVLGGRPHVRVRIEDEVAPIVLLLDRATGLVTALRTVENGNLRRDVDVEITYAEWGRLAGANAPLWPGHIQMTFAGLQVSDQRITAATVTPAIASDTFALLAPPAPYDPAQSLRGRQTEHFFSAFSSIGVPLDELDPGLGAVEVIPGVYFLSTTLTNQLGHNQVVVDQGDRAVVFDAPLLPERTELLRRWVATNLPGRTISDVIVSHDHQDHAGGARTFAAYGARLAVGSDSEAFWRDSVLSATSRVRPDPLSILGVTPTLTAVGPSADLTLGTGDRAVTAFAAPNHHAADMLFALVESKGQRLLFESDLFNPGVGTFAAGGGFDLTQDLQARGLIDATCKPPVPLFIAGGHGGVEPVEQVITEIRKNEDLSALGCQP